MTPQDTAISTRGLVRTFGAVTAVDRVDLDVPRGAFFALLGPNGSGKSTTVRILSGMLSRDGGSVSVLGLDPQRDPVAVARRVGVVPDFPVVYDVLSPRENILAIARLRGLWRGEAQARLEDLAGALAMAEHLDTPVRALSTGTRKKVALAAAMIHAPALLFLDEPFEGIDPVAAQGIRDMLAELRSRGTTLFVTSHVLPLMEAAASHAAVLDEGRIRLAGELGELLQAGHDLEHVVLERLGARRAVPELGWYRP